MTVDELIYHLQFLSTNGFGQHPVLKTNIYKNRFDSITTIEPKFDQKNNEIVIL